MSGRRALAWLLALGALGAVAVDEIEPARPPQPGETLRAQASGGSFSCPIAFAGEGSGQVSIANVGDQPSAVRITIVPNRGRVSIVRRTLEPYTTFSTPVQNRTRGQPAGAIVEFAGSEVVASHSLAFGQRGGAAAAPCGRPGPQTTVITQASTLDVDTELVLMNPGAGDAVVDIALVSAGRVLRPEKLRGRLVRARRRLIVDVGDFVFDAFSVTAIVTSETGRVVAEALRRAPRPTGLAVNLVESQVPSRSLVAVAGAGGPGGLGLSPIGSVDSVVDGRLITAGEQGRSQEVPTEVRFPGPHNVVLGPTRPAAYAIDVRGGSAIVGSTTWQVTRRGRVDVAGITAMAPTRDWAAVAYAGRGGSGRAVIVNSGVSPASVGVRMFGPQSPALEEREIGPGRLVSLPLPPGPGTVGVEVRSSQPVTVALDGLPTSASFSAGAMAGVPLPEPRPIAVGIDPRLGVPAPLTRKEER